MERYVETVKGTEDGKKGNPIPENASSEYRKSYAQRARLNYQAARNLTVCTFLNIFAVAGLVVSNVYYSGNRNELQIEREDRIRSFYQNYDNCPSDPSAAGIEGRVQHWLKEIESK